MYLSHKHVLNKHLKIEKNQLSFPIQSCSLLFGNVHFMSSFRVAVTEVSLLT